MTCMRYVALRYRWLAAVEDARREDKDQPSRQAAADRQLQSLRAHREVCEDCLAEFQTAYPELAGITLENNQEVLEVEKL